MLSFIFTILLITDLQAETAFSWGKILKLEEVIKMRVDSNETKNVDTMDIYLLEANTLTEILEIVKVDNDQHAIKLLITENSQLKSGWVIIKTSPRDVKIELLTKHHHLKQDQKKVSTRFYSKDNQLDSKEMYRNDTLLESTHLKVLTDNWPIFYYHDEEDPENLKSLEQLHANDKFEIDTTQNTSTLSNALFLPIRGKDSNGKPVLFYIRRNDKSLISFTKKSLNAINKSRLLKDCFKIKTLPHSSPIKSKHKCINFDISNYRETTGKKIVKLMKSYRTIKERNVAFLDYFAPLAVHIQKLTNYPASVILSQIALETEWGTSGILRKATNIAGYSCTKKGHVQTHKVFTASINSSTFTSTCSAKRPTIEGDYYRSFNNILEAAYVYINNLTESNVTKVTYKNIRSLIAKANKDKTIPNAKEIIKGLQAYATDPHYRKKLRQTYNSNKLGRYDEMPLCH